MENGITNPANPLNPVTKAHETRSFFVEGVTCAGCVGILEDLALTSPFIQYSRFNLGTQTLRIQKTPESSWDAVVAEVAKVGYTLHDLEKRETPALDRENKKRLIELGVSGALAGNIMMFSLPLYLGVEPPFDHFFKVLSGILAIPAVFYSGRSLFKTAWTELRQGRLAIDLPIAFALTSGMAISFYGLFTGVDRIYFDSLSALVFLLSASRYYLLREEQRRSAFWRERSHLKQEPLRDQYVLRGTGTIENAWLTGEAFPYTVSQGSFVPAGSTWIEKSEDLELKTSAEGADTQLGKLLTEIQSTQSAPSQLGRRIDRLGRMIFFGILCAGVMGFAVLWSTLGFPSAMERLMLVFLVSCPCVFALATPLTYGLALERARDLGFLIKSSDFLDRLTQVRHIFFDKTGTLSTGAIEIESVEVQDSERWPLYSLASQSLHPVSRAIQGFLGAEQFREALEITQGKDHPGYGIEGEIRGFVYRLTKPKDVQSSDAVEFYKNGQKIGQIRYREGVHPDSKTLIQRLRHLGYSLRLLTGDHPSRAFELAQKIQIQPEEVFANLSPFEKKDHITGQDHVLFIGDGANDALPAPATTSHAS